MFTMSKEDKFNFDIDNIKQDFAIENINIQCNIIFQGGLNYESTTTTINVE